MEFLNLAIELFRNADQFILHIAEAYGIWIYIVLFLIFFAETGIVICAFCPVILSFLFRGSRSNRSHEPDRSHSGLLQPVPLSETQPTFTSDRGWVKNLRRLDWMD